MNLHIQEGEQTPRSLNSKRFHTETHNQTVKRQKKRKSGKQKSNLSQTRNPQQKLTASFSSETMEARRQWVNTFEVLKEIIPISIKI